MTGHQELRQACIAMTLDAGGNNPGAEGFDSTGVTQYGFSIVPASRSPCSSGSGRPAAKCSATT